MKLVKVLLVGIVSLVCSVAYAQDVKVTAKLVDESTGEGLGFATVSLIRDGQTKPSKYVLSDNAGKVTLESVRKGTYTFKAELMGYDAFTKSIKVDASDVNLGTIKLKVDAELLSEASVSAVGNPIVVKKDTIEYNATSFRTTESDVLEDLLKKLPGVEVSDEGTITVNGESVSKITIDGKTFFLNDPELASKNIPAKLVQKLKVIKKKSEQAEFTGIDDGQEETVIDLSVQPGMMRGLVGNITAGGGMDISPDSGVKNEFRYQGNGMIGRFNKGSNISLILNANNTNGGGAGNFAGNAMRGMMGGMGGGRGGITTSYMAGLNGAFDLLDDKMQLGGNYVFNGSKNDSQSSSWSRDRNPGYVFDKITNGTSTNLTNSMGHRFGIRLEHKFSENTSILFEPQVNFGTGNYSQVSASDVDYEYRDGSGIEKISKSNTNNTGDNRNVATSGHFLFRQRLGLPGRTLTADVNYQFSNNTMEGFNVNSLTSFNDPATSKNVNQRFDSNSKNSSVRTNVTYTEPLGDYFYIQANYGYNWSKQSSEKTTYDLLNNGVIDYDYSNNIVNVSRNQEIGVDALYQSKIFHAQAGFALLPQYTYNSTTQSNKPREYEDNRLNFSPRIMMFWDASDKLSNRLFYRGNSAQPSTQQLMPVEDNTNPLSVSFGNPTLTPYFTHNLNGDIRYNNREKFSSFNVRFNGRLTQNPIVNTTWRNTATGGSYSLPFNGKNTAGAGLNFFFNVPFGKSAFSVSNTLGSNWSLNTAYQGFDIDMSTYTKDGFYAFMDEFVKKFNDPAYYNSHIVENRTNNLSINERLRFVYRGKELEATLGGSTRMSQSWYDMNREVTPGQPTSSTTTTWNNSVSLNLTWNWALANMSLRADYDFNWFNGYSTEQPAQNILNLRVSKNIKSVSLELRANDIFGQTRNLTVSNDNYIDRESITNNLGRYIIFAVSYRFGSMGGRRGSGGMRMGGGGPGMGGPGMGGPGMMGGGMHGGRP